MVEVIPNLMEVNRVVMDFTGVLDIGLQIVHHNAQVMPFVVKF